MLKKLYCQFDVDIDIDLIDPVLIRSGYSTVSGPDLAPVMTWRNNLSSGPEPFFPGTSLKGVTRSHIERICRTLKDHSACLPYDKTGCSEKLKHRKKQQGSLHSHEAYGYACPVCRLFGSLSFTGRCQIGDAYLKTPGEFKKEQRDGIAINRYTGGTVKGAKFEQEVITRGQFTTHLSLQNFELYQLGLVAFFLRDITEGQIQLGSGKSRGLGRIQGALRNAKLTYYGAQAPQQLSGLAEMATETEVQQYQLKSGKQSVALPPATENHGYRSVWRLEPESLMQILAASAEGVPQGLFKGALL